MKLLARKLALTLDEKPEVIAYEMDLALRAMANDWSTQEIVNLIIAWRRKHRYPYLAERQNYERILNTCTKLLKFPVPDEAELTFVYFVEAVGAKLVKIGKASNPEKRLKQLQTSSPHPLKILLLIPGGHDLENELHGKFSHLRSEGEWFKVTEEITSYLDEHKKLTDEVIELIFLNEDAVDFLTDQ